MNNWLNKLERKYGRYGIPNLTNILVAGQILVLAIELFIDRTITGWLGLNRFLLLQGQVWRVISFIFIPFSGGSILSVVLGIYFTWFIGTALEREWGDFRYTVYLLSGVLGTVLVERTQSFTLGQSLGFGLGSGLGYVLAVLLVTEARHRLRSRAIPKAFRGLPITLVYIGVLALAIYGFTGHSVIL